ncbi:hypothetical protein NQ318_009476 [Aromia moschata]|uniref:Uncharacterized protein n=1 Tax=Aromia moschata TaxID=1265417 RepID=A0AAV8Z870_9CUCU|nr:hypothetical protein NQ318_009476 [Aromia moschata]
MFYRHLPACGSTSQRSKGTFILKGRTTDDKIKEEDNLFTAQKKRATVRAALGRVCMKLVVVMGITWIADLISFAAGGPQEVWYVPDLINCIHGVFIFIVVGCQPQSLGMRKVCAKLVPNVLTDNQKARGVETCQELLDTCEDNPAFLDDDLVPIEIFVLHDYQNPKIRSLIESYFP